MVNNFAVSGLCTLKLPNNTTAKKCILKIKHMKYYLALNIFAINGLTHNLKSWPYECLVYIQVTIFTVSAADLATNNVRLFTCTEKLCLW